MEKALVIDLDGTLYSRASEETATKLWTERILNFLASRDISTETNSPAARKFRASVRYSMVSQAILDASNAFGIPLAKLSKYTYDVDPKRCDIIRDQALRKLLSAASRKYELWLFTNSDKVWADRAVKELGVRELFNGNMVHLQHMGYAIKPNPKAFRLMSKRVGHGYKKMIFVDNNSKNVLVAKSLGIKSMFADNSGRKINRTYSILERLSA